MADGTPERYDTLIANLYPFSENDPLEAMRELAHRVKPGGRLVLTGIEAQHGAEEPEMPGFERGELETWLAQAGLVNRIVERIEIAGQGEAPGQQTSLPGLFVAVGARRLAGVEEAVRENYAALAQGEGSCCTPAADAASCCGGETLISLDSIGETAVEMEQIFTTDYTPADKEAIPSQAAEFSLGCGNPTAFAALQPGEVVLDIGSGGGLDALIAARQVGPQGRVIGVDMTPEMLERARRAAAAAGFGNVEFRQGQADALPVESGSVDVIISNCVINLTPDKGTGVPGSVAGAAPWRTAGGERYRHGYCLPAGRAYRRPGVEQLCHRGAARGRVCGFDPAGGVQPGDGAALRGGAARAG